jgi:hypothetical protein
VTSFTVRVGTSFALLIAHAAFSIALGIILIAPFCIVTRGTIEFVAVTEAGKAFELAPIEAHAYKIIPHEFTGFSVIAVEILVRAAECAAVSHHDETFEKKHDHQHSN